MINYYCPDFESGIDVYKWLVQAKKDYPYIFKDDINIKTIFGSFPNMIWSGGGNNLGFAPRDKIEDMIKEYTDMNIPLTLTCTNPVLEKTDVYDRYCNEILSMFNNGINKILVSSPYLEDYIRYKYPNYKICKSIISTEYDEDWEALLDKYDIIVLPRRKLKDFDFLKSIKEENRSRFEILCNDPCPINCPFMYSHYRRHGRAQLYEENIDTAFCLLPFRKKPRWEWDTSGQILPNEVVEQYYPLGYTEFKIAGRGHVNDVIFSLIPYIIKEEYQMYVMQELVCRCNPATP